MEIHLEIQLFSNINLNLIRICLKKRKFLGDH